MATNVKLCLVEDDPTIRDLVAKRLETEGFHVDVFASAEEVLGRDLTQPEWELFVLDIMLAGNATGLDLCQAVRAHSPSLPVLVLSALSDPADRVEGLKAGADDYLTKPFEMEELLLRIRGMLKRRSWYKEMPSQGAVYRWAKNSVDFLKFEGTAGDKRFSLSQKECMLMKLLIEKEGHVVSRDEILDRVWGYDIFPSTRTVDNFILRLRKLFEPAPSDPRYIQSVRGAGYRFVSK